MDKLQQLIGITFKNKKFLGQALAHRSFLNENRGKGLQSNERLEFLGDAVLELWATEQLFFNFPKLPEGVLTNIRSAIVCTESLAETAKSFDLGKYFLLSKGEELGGGRNNPSLLADTFEALVGAIYLDSGKDAANDFLNRYLLQKILNLGRKGNIKDAKTRLQEIVQAVKKLTPYYKVEKEEGPDHAKIFTCAVYFGDKKIACGRGLSKKESEEQAAEKALTILEKEVD